MPISLATQLSNFLSTLPTTQHIWIAYSGGVDSHVLLHLLAQQPPSATVHAIHIHHGLQAQADDWAQHCSRVCQQLNIDFHLIHVDIDIDSGDSIEALARDARYDAIQHLISENDIVLTAQHADDQTETVLLQLFRGSGVAGLAAMPSFIQFGQGWLGRPFLHCSRQQIVEYAKAKQLRWVEDGSNQDTRFERNFLRHEMIPALSQRWPQINQALGRVAQHQAEANTLLQELAEQDLQLCQTPQQNLDITALQTLSEARQRNVIRYWLKIKNFIMPSTLHLQQILTECIQAKQDAQPLIKWANVEVRRYQNTLFAMSELPQPPTGLVFDWHPQQTLDLPIGQLQAHFGNGAILETTLQVKFRQGGEKLYLRGHTRNVKKLLQQSHILPWLRPFLPLIYYKNQLVAIPNIGVDEQFQALLQDDITIKWVISA
ncbi:tRNA lysidine(34) synthetase TilS [Candidatus Albibeggiatoa sp. nov. NOAA]|uniref:tRNA lysidine(34) synthetase TilS n=1 Tax=Candidatus Albibeggiatoa sp. nov. NOAA TaxID=3162724 RepID=UPI0033010C7C|nr:tRNA lysidine(34) synthetase TilS [Thiotrichaceae bacterium]